MLRAVLNFAVSVGSGADAAIRKSYVAQDTINDALYSVAQVQQGTVALGGSSLAVVQAEGRPVQSIFVYRFKPGSISETKWAVNLQVHCSFLLRASPSCARSARLECGGCSASTFVRLLPDPCIKQSLPLAIDCARLAARAVQASAPGPQTFFLTAAAASPNSGDLFLVGTYSGVFTIGGFNMTSSGSFDIFVAAGG